MRNFLALCLALVFGFVGTIALSSLSKGLAVDNLVFERVASMTSSESHNSSANSNVVEVDGIRFETLVPERMYRLPKYEEETPIQFGVRITNNSSTPYRFDLPNFLPEILDKHGKVMQMGGGRNATGMIEESDVPLIIPGEKLEYWMNAKFMWFGKNCIQLTGIAQYGLIWNFYNFLPGKYQIRLTYNNPLPTRKIQLVKEIDGFWIGKVATPFARLRLR